MKTKLQTLVQVLALIEHHGLDYTLEGGFAEQAWINIVIMFEFDRLLVTSEGNKLEFFVSVDDEWDEMDSATFFECIEEEVG